MSYDHRAFRVSRILFFVLVLSCLALPLKASAEGSSPSGGVRLGVSGSPDQFYVGGHYDTGYIFNHLSFRPNLEVGFGDHQTAVTANFEFAYWFPVRNQPFQVYVGGGPALNIYRYDLPDGSTTDAKGGFSLLVGAEHRSGLFGEVKIGLADSPGVKIGVGYTWR
jgi:hypothetical protein